MNIKIEYDYKKEIPDLVKKLSEKNIKRLSDFLEEINSGRQLNPKGSAVISFNARNEEMLIFLYSEFFLRNTDIFYSSLYECNGEQCFLDLNDEQNEVLNYLEKIIKKEQIENKIKQNINIENIGKELLIISQETGKVSFINKVGKKYEVEFKTYTNSFKLLMFLCHHPKTLHSYKTLSEQINKPRSHSDHPSIDRRIRDTVKEIKDKLNGIPLTTDRGYKLDCSVQIN